MSNPPPELQLDFVEDEKPAVYTDVPELQDEQEPSPIVEMKAMMDKEPIDDGAIFGDAPAPAPEPEPPKAPAKKRREKPVKYNKDGSVRKPRQYTDEQRKAMSERMKKVRLQAHKNKAKKDEERAKEAKHKELLKAKRDMEIEEIEAKIKKKSQPKEDTGAPLARTDTITRADIEKAQFDAIMKYDTLRKERKAKKKQAQQVEQYHKEVKENLKKELGWRDVAGPYADCF